MSEGISCKHCGNELDYHGTKPGGLFKYYCSHCGKHFELTIKGLMRESPDEIINVFENIFKRK
jgi:transposase-like protein